VALQLINGFISGRVIKMLEKKFVDALRILKDKLRDIDFYIIGSAGMAINGMDVIPGDIDAIVRISNIREAYDRLRDHVKKPIYEKEFPGAKSLVVLADITGIEVEVLGKPDDDEYYRRILDGRIKEHDLGGVSVKCINLEAEYEVMAPYRPEKAKRIREFLE